MPVSPKRKQQNLDHQRKFQAKKKMNEQQLLKEFVTEFTPGLRFQFVPVDDDTLDNPVKLEFVTTDEGMTRRIVQFAGERNIDVEVLLDRVAKAGMKNLNPAADFIGRV